MSVFAHPRALPTPSTRSPLGALLAAQLCALAVVGCRDPEPLPPPPPDIKLGKPEPTRPAATLSNALAGATRGPLRVQVREVRQAGTYTALQIGDAETQAPLLAPALLVEVGAMVEVSDYVLRRGFSLDGVGTFDAVLIATRVVGPGVRHQLHLVRAGAELTDLPPGHPPSPQQGVPLAETLTPTADRIAAIPEGLPTIAELRANREELAWREVAVRGLVTGRTLRALGRNWLQIEDGSGEQIRLPLLVSTQAAPPLGELVRAQGMLHIHEDVGAGVVHPVLLAEATVTVDNAAPEEPPEDEEP